MQFSLEADEKAEVELRPLGLAVVVVVVMIAFFLVYLS
jgi:hypothetical protein